MPGEFQKMPQRIIVTAKDVECITGRSSRTAQRLLQQLREKLGKHKNAFITVDEFCLCTGIEKELVQEFLRY